VVWTSVFLPLSELQAKNDNIVELLNIHTYIYIISFRRYTYYVVKTVVYETFQKKNNTQTENTKTHHKTNKTNMQLSILQSPNTCSVNNTIIE
jgi:hypothetical protein